MWVLVGISSAVLASEPGAVPELTASQIVEKNITAKGGLDAWRKIQTMVWAGHIEAENAHTPSLPFVLEMKRPNKTRFEIRAQSQAAMRVFDGSHGWKLRPASNGMPELQPYTAEELSFAQDGQVIDGPLMDYQAKGVDVTLGGVDEVDGHKAYRLNVKLPSGTSHHVWIDTQTFLDIKSDRESRNAFGQPGTVSVFYRDYRAIEGLQIPLTIETGAGSVKATSKMVIDKVVLNPPLEDGTFSKPSVPGRRNVVTIDTTRRPLGARGAWPGSSAPSGFSRLPPRSMSSFGNAQ